MKQKHLIGIVIACVLILIVAVAIKQNSPTQPEQQDQNSVTESPRPTHDERARAYEQRLKEQDAQQRQKLKEQYEALPESERQAFIREQAIANLGGSSDSRKQEIRKLQGELREKLKQMSPEERQQFIKELAQSYVQSKGQKPTDINEPREPNEP